MKEKSFGKTSDGLQAKLYTIENGNGMSVALTDFGAAIVSIMLADKNGNVIDVALGFDDVNGYEKQEASIGAIIGRHANRIRNGRFILNGKEYNLYCNGDGYHLHGGKVGFSKKLWTACENKENSVCFCYSSADGEEGYPGELTVRVTYTLTDKNELAIDYYAKSSADTVINLTNHCYFNLAGHDDLHADNQLLMINADYYTPIDSAIVTNGEIMSVLGTPLDFRRQTRISDRIKSDNSQIRLAGGYDHNWVLNKNEHDEFSHCATLYSEDSGIEMNVYTTKPGVQFYSGNFLDGTEVGKGNIPYTHRAGVCLETQFFPNAMEHTHFPSPLLRSGDEYIHKTTYSFSVKR